MTSRPRSAPFRRKRQRLEWPPRDEFEEQSVDALLARVRFGRLRGSEACAGDARPEVVRCECVSRRLVDRTQVALPEGVRPFIAYRCGAECGVRCLLNIAAHRLRLLKARDFHPHFDTNAKAHPPVIPKRARGALPGPPPFRR